MNVAGRGRWHQGEQAGRQENMVMFACRNFGNRLPDKNSKGIHVGAIARIFVSRYQNKSRRINLEIGHFQKPTFETL